MQRSQDLPKMGDLEPRRLYRIDSRNLHLGVWDGKGGFIGIREKFGDHFLFIEYHYDFSTSYGTVSGAQETDQVLPSGIALEEGAITQEGYRENRDLFAWLSLISKDL